MIVSFCNKQFSIDENHHMLLTGRILSILINILKMPIIDKLVFTKGYGRDGER